MRCEMITVCAVCQKTVCCQDKGFPIMCCECPADDFEQETGQPCQEKLNAKEAYLIVCPLCHFQVMLNNLKFGG